MHVVGLSCLLSQQDPDGIPAIGRLAAQETSTGDVYWVSIGNVLHTHYIHNKVFNTHTYIRTQ